MAASPPSKRFVALLTIPLLTNILATLATSTNLITSSSTSFPSATLPSIFLKTTILLSLVSTGYIVYQSRYDRLILVFIPPLFTAALAMAVLLALLPVFGDATSVARHSGVAEWILVFSAIPVGAGSLLWLLASYGWLAFGEFQPNSTGE